MTTDSTMSVAEALAKADQHADTHADVPSVSRTLAAEVRRLSDRVAELERERSQSPIELFKWISELKCFNLRIGRDVETSINRETVASFAARIPEFYDAVPEDALERMKQANTDWNLTIYPTGTVGQYSYHDSTLAGVIEQAKNDL